MFIRLAHSSDGKDRKAGEEAAIVCQLAVESEEWPNSHDEIHHEHGKRYEEQAREGA